MKNLLPFLLLLICAGLFAQPTFQSSDMYDAGYVYQNTAVTNSSAINLTVTGANAVWNFPSLTAGETTTTTLLNPAGQPGASNFPLATIAQATTSSQGNPGYAYFKKTASVFSLDGAYASSSGTVSQYIPDLDLFHFPMTYNSTFTQAVGGTTTTGAYVFYRNGSQNAIVDGYGTLTTPQGTFNNVLRMKTIQTYSDSAYISGISSVYNYEITIYNWISVESHGVSLLSYSSFGVNGATPVVSAGMSTVPTLSVNETPEQLGFKIFPNPANDIVNVQLAVSKNEDFNAEIYTVTGELVKSIAFKRGNGNLVSFSTEGLCSGTYFLRLNSKDKIGIQRFIIL